MTVSVFALDCQRWIRNLNNFVPETRLGKIYRKHWKVLLVGNTQCHSFLRDSSTAHKPLKLAQKHWHFLWIWGLPPPHSPPSHWFLVLRGYDHFIFIATSLKWRTEVIFKLYWSENSGAIEGDCEVSLRSSMHQSYVRYDRLQPWIEPVS